MTHDDWDVLAAEYVLGVMDETGRSTVERMLAEDPSRLRSIEDWQSWLSAMIEHEGSLDPPADIWRGIEASLDGPATVTVRAGEGEWEEMSEGVDRKLLLDEPERECESFLLRIRPGASVPAHVHNVREECVMLEGDVRIGEQLFSAGDYHVIPASLPHPVVTSEHGALIFVRSEPGDAGRSAPC